MDEFRLRVKEEVLSANRGPFGGWWEALLEVDPDLLLRVHRYLKIAEESGPLSKAFRHLVLAVVDSVVTHLYPRGVGVHARIALDAGASLRQIVEALEIAALVSSRGYGIALPIITEELIDAGHSIGGRSDATRAAVVRGKFDKQVGDWPSWMDLALNENPDALEALLALAHGRTDEAGLDAKSRELLFLAANACPAIVERDAIRRHARRALELGAGADELLQVVRLANCIGLHAISEGILQVRSLVNA